MIFSPTFSPSSAFSGWKEHLAGHNQWLLHRVFRRARVRKDLLALLNMTCANHARTIVAMPDYISSLHCISFFFVAMSQSRDYHLRFFMIRNSYSLLAPQSFLTRLIYKLFLLSQDCDLTQYFVFEFRNDVNTSCRNVID